MSQDPEERGPEPAEEPDRDGAGWKKTVLICALILLGAAGIAALTFLTEPTATRGGATRETAMLVDVTRVERETVRPVIVATGSVEAEQDIVLRPQVEGEIVWRAPEFVPGGFVEEGQTLLRIEPADYRNTLQQRQSDLRQAIAELELERGRQEVARDDYALLAETLPAENKSLVLRRPQLDAAQVQVESARAAVNQARLDLQRTTIEAPFAAHIVSREVNLGSQVSREDTLGRLVGLDAYWVEATIPLAKLRWISLPGASGEKGSEVRVRNRSSWPEGVHRTGHVDKVIGALDERTRMARVLVSVPDPLARRTGSKDAVALMVGEFLEARIEGVEIADVVRLDRDYVRDDDTAWVMEDGRLRIRELEIAVRDAEHAYVSGGLDDGDRVVTTNLSTVTDGARLRLRDDGEGAAP